jgi:hypothetical protein
MNGRSVAIIAIAGIAALVYFGGFRIYVDPRARMYAPETAALVALQTLNTAQVQYYSQFGRYARSLAELGPSAADLISADLAAGDKQGYRFTLTSTPTGYTATAAPSTFCGTHTYYSDQSLVIREHYGPQPATASSKEAGSAAKQP